MKKYNLVILPGWEGSHKTWQGFFDFIKKNKIENINNVKVVDLPCFGDEPCPEEIWGVKEYAEFVNSKIKEFNFNNIILLGHSFGGAVAVKFTVENPKRVEKLILSGPAVSRPKKTLKRVFFGAIAKIGKFIFKLPILKRFDIEMKKLLYKFADSPDYLDTNGIKRDIFKKIIRQDQTHLLSDIEVKTLLIWGEKDKLVSVDKSSEFASKIPESSLEIIKGGRHGLHIHNQKELRNIIAGFLSD